MTVKELKDLIKDLPDDVVIVSMTEGYYSVIREANLSFVREKSYQPRKRYKNYEQAVEDSYRGRDLIFVYLSNTPGVFT